MERQTTTIRTGKWKLSVAFRSTEGSIYKTEEEQDSLDSCLDRIAEISDDAPKELWLVRCTFRFIPIPELNS